jgi:hypothetical protein
VVVLTLGAKAKSLLSLVLTIALGRRGALGNGVLGMSLTKAAPATFAAAMALLYAWLLNRKHVAAKVDQDAKDSAAAAAAVAAAAAEAAAAAAAEAVGATAAAAAAVKKATQTAKKFAVGEVVRGPHDRALLCVTGFDLQMLATCS